MNVTRSTLTLTYAGGAEAAPPTPSSPTPGFLAGDPGSVLTLALVDGPTRGGFDLTKSVLLRRFQLLSVNGGRPTWTSAPDVELFAGGNPDEGVQVGGTGSAPTWAPGAITSITPRTYELGGPPSQAVQTVEQLPDAPTGTAGCSGSFIAIASGNPVGTYTFQITTRGPS